MKIKILKYFLLLGVIISSIVLADYFSLFGTSTKKVLGFSELRIKPFDESTGAPVYGATATCYRHRNHDMCTVRESGRKDIISVQFPYHKIITRSWLFNQSEDILMPEDRNIKIMIIHNDYHNPKNDFDMKDIHEHSGKLISINMKPRDWKEKTEDMSEVP